MSALQREPCAELMDQPDVEVEALEQSLADLRDVNRWFGGAHAALSPLLPLIREVRAAEVRVLDVATGSADIPLRLVHRARNNGLSVTVLATDLHAQTVAAARRNAAATPEVEVARADALALPHADGEFHIAMCHTALHHFSEADAVRLMRGMSRVASHAVLVSDLARSRVAMTGVTLLARTLWRRHPVTRHDSIASIRGAFTAAEAAALATSAGWPSPRVRHHPFFRFSVVAKLPGEV